MDESKPNALYEGWESKLSTFNGFSTSFRALTNLKSIAYTFTWLCLSSSWLLASSPNMEIRLQGAFNFNQVIESTEDQLDVSIDLPIKIISKSTREYNQIITLKQLCEAIVQHYAQDDVPVTYSFSQGMVKFVRSDIPKTTSKRVYTPKPTPAPKKTYSPPPKVPTLTTPPEPTPRPTLPDWANREPVKQTPSIDELPSLSKNGIQRQPIHSGMPTDLEDPFEFDIPARSTPRAIPPQNTIKRNPTPPPVQSYNPPAATQPRATPTRTPRQQPSSKFGITPYPDGAVAFINDAPSIVPGTGRENYLEWETRMKGALENQNVNVLKNERLELERRLRWLDKKLP